MAHTTKRLLFVFFIIMAYLPMTMAYAVPTLSVAEQTPAVVDMNMDMDMDMDMKNCHNQQNKMSQNCGHCTDKHNCNNATGSCSTSVSIVSQSYGLNRFQDLKTVYLSFRDNARFQRSKPLFRPPISL